MLLIGDTESLIDKEVYTSFDKIGKDMLGQFWRKRQDSTTNDAHASNDNQVRHTQFKWVFK